MKFALLGCGSVANKHAHALNLIPEADLVAVCDISAEAARAFGEKNQVAYFDSPHAMMQKTKPDVVSILTPSGCHFKDIMELVRYKCNFLVEKPLTLRLDEADDAIIACHQAGNQLCVVKQNRCNKPIVKLKEAIDKGRFGKMVMGTIRLRWSRDQTYYDSKDWRGTWAYDGGVLTNQASHHLDMLCWLMGRIDSVQANIATRLADIEVEDTAGAVISFQNGALGIIEATTATRPKDMEGSISIMGEKGIVEIGGFFMNKLKTWEFEDQEPEDETIFTDWGENPSEWAWNHTEYIKTVIKSLVNRAAVPVDGLEARRSLELIHAMYESSETGKRVRLRFMPEHCRLGIINGHIG